VNDAELVELLLSNYREQYSVYQSLLTNLNAGLPTNGKPPEMSKIISVLEERKKAFDRIQVLDSRIQRNKIGWDRRKNDVNTIEAETLKTVLRNIRQILAQVMAANERLEAIVNSAVQ